MSSERRLLRRTPQPPAKPRGRSVFGAISAATAIAAALALIAVTVGVLWSLRGGIAAPVATPTPTLPATSPSQAPPTDSPSPTPPAASPSPFATATTPQTPPTALVAYTQRHCEIGPFHQLVCKNTPWIAASDGSSAHVLSATATGAPMGWSADGSRLLLMGDSDLFVTDAAGSELATFPIWCPDKPFQGMGRVPLSHKQCAHTHATVRKGSPCRRMGLVSPSSVPIPTIMTRR